MDHKNFNQTDAMVSYFETGEKEGLLLNSVYPEEERHVEIYQYGKGTVVTYDTSKDPHAPIDWILIEKLDNLYS